MEMIRRLVSVAVTAVILVPFLLTMPVNASPGDIRVPEDYPTIQAAIDNVTAQNRTILVNALTYNATETVDVTASNVTIRSVNGRANITAGGADDHVFNITGQTNVTLEGFTIRDARGTSKDLAGIFMHNATACSISNNVVTNITATGSWNARGIWLDDSHNNTFGSSTAVSHVNATGNAVGILLYRSDTNTFSSSTDVSHVNATNGTAGILLYLSNNNTFSSTTNVSYVNGTNSSVGMLLDVSENNAFGSSTTVSYVNASDEAVGIVLRGAANNTLKATVIESVDSAAADAVGLGLSDSADNEFYDCAIRDLTAGNETYGVLVVENSTNNTISDGEVRDTNHGICVQDSDNNKIQRNMIVNNTGGATGVNVTHDSDRNTMEGNCFIDNIPQARDDGGGNVWNGNYWSDHTGSGPYNIGGAANSADDNPLDECPLVVAPAPPPAPPRIPAVNQWGIVAMIGLFAGLLVWMVWRRRHAS